MNKHYFILSGVLLILINVSISCRSDRKEFHKPAIENLDEKILNANKLIVKDEAKDIELLLKRYGWKMQLSGSGLYYSITDKKEGDLLQKGDKVEMNFSITLINGEEVYNSKHDGTKTIVIEQSDEPVGLHELLKLMRVGEKAKAIIPSHLAYGILGDNNKIPPYATLIYRIEIIK